MLYHASLYKTKELMPGYNRTGKLVCFEDQQTNEYLYIAATMNEAIMQALYAAIKLEAKDNVTIWLDCNNTVQIKTDNVDFDINSVLNKTAYIYSFEPRHEDLLTIVACNVNQRYTQWKTKQTIDESRLSLTEVSLKKWSNFLRFSIRYQ